MQKKGSKIAVIWEGSRTNDGLRGCREAVSGEKLLVLEDAADHLLHNVIAAAADYEAAERDLTSAYLADATPAAWETEARTAKRRAAELAIAIDGLADRCTSELGLSLTVIRSQVSALCLWPGSGAPRTGALARVMGVANVYKHQNLSNPESAHRFGSGCPRHRPWLRP